MYVFGFFFFSLLREHSIDGTGWAPTRTLKVLFPFGCVHQTRYIFKPFLALERNSSCGLLKNRFFRWGFCLSASVGGSSGTSTVLIVEMLVVLVWLHKSCSDKKFWRLLWLQVTLENPHYVRCAGFHPAANTRASGEQQSIILLISMGLIFLTKSLQILSHCKALSRNLSSCCCSQECCQNCFFSSFNNIR